MHLQTQNGVEKGESGQVGNKEGRGIEPRTFRIEFPAKSGLMLYPVKGCSGQVVTRTGMQVQFWHRNVRYTMVIQEEVNLPHPRCPLCGMLVPCRSLNMMHWRTAQCRKGAERKRRSLEAEEERAVTSRTFSAYRRPLEMVTSFRYLGRVISAADNDCPEMVRDLSQAREMWKRMTRILSREGAEPRVSGFFFKAMV